jgi:hypothetical protein
VEKNDTGTVRERERERVRERQREDKTVNARRTLGKTRSSDKQGSQ